ncbi:hypothetical protein N4G70_04010 [Streptomyces sp. ASQP_92]|uniref:hypothetical protein n=1 Tax=Streptomyces sp. ASQP_92 TaxID=2979116 RepID=UPI0021BDF482|nr:hypothetical protein [Streptomyces sp. ASQP_92]MCT9088023.1 hypothetical protein [Streptomyces sp. ASQP_92]
MATRSVPSPNGAHQELVRALEELHRAAGHPGMRKVSALIAEGDHPAVVSHEGVRTALKGLNVPRWETVQSIVAVLATACVDPPRDPTAEVARFLPLWRAVREGEPGGMKSARELALSQGWGTDDGHWTAEAVVGVMINPFNAIEIAPSLAVPHEPLVSEDEWVQLGTGLIEEYGAEFALRAILRNLKGDYLGAEEGSPFGYEFPDQEAVEAHTAFRYGCDRLLQRLATEPNLLQRSIVAMHADETMDREDRIEMLRAESDASLMREVMVASPETWHELSEEAQHQVFGYLIKTIGPVGRFGLPPEQRFHIVWRIAEPPPA